ncbi:MAG TPA: tetratricopeptide repeat protein, partial [Polyangia bacterium]
LAKALLKREPDAAVRELEEAAKLEVMDGSIPKALVEIYAKDQRWADVVRTARLSQLIDPYDIDVHAALARALFALGRAPEARVEIALAQKCAPSDEQRAALKAITAPAPAAGSKAGAPPPPSPR